MSTLQKHRIALQAKVNHPADATLDRTATALQPLLPVPYIAEVPGFTVMTKACDLFLQFTYRILRALKFGQITNQLLPLALSQLTAELVIKRVPLLAVQPQRR